jgi:hypothetical protein
VIAGALWPACKTPEMALLRTKMTYTVFRPTVLCMVLRTRLVVLDTACVTIVESSIVIFSSVSSYVDWTIEV